MQYTPPAHTTGPDNRTHNKRHTQQGTTGLADWDMQVDMYNRTDKMHYRTHNKKDAHNS